MPTLIHINDNNLLIQDGNTISNSQGYAWLKDSEVFFDFDSDNNAVKHSRLDPQRINNRYWQQCEQTAIIKNDSGMRHAADLIWQHLTKLTDNYLIDEVIFIIPSHYQTTNLQLLLGIAKSCGLIVKGLVNKAVYALHHETNVEGHYAHIDVQLHQAVCSLIEVSDSVVQLGSVEVINDVGLSAMQDSLLKSIQHRFIANDRFDPLHHAETEQQLFDQLLNLAAELKKSGKTNVAIDHELQQHLSSIDRKQWNSALSDFTTKLSNIEFDSAIEHRFYDFNGFEDAMLATETEFSISTVPAVSNDFISTLKSIMSSKGSLIYLTELSVNEQTGSVTKRSKATTKDDSPNAKVDSAPSQSTANNQLVASHLLHSGIAVPIESAIISFKNNQLGLSEGKATNVSQLIKDKKLFIMSDMDRSTFQVNDRLGSNFADGVISVIQVVAIKNKE